jgi:hypothetical protein
VWPDPNRNLALELVRATELQAPHQPSRHPSRPRAGSFIHGRLRWLHRLPMARPEPSTPRSPGRRAARLATARYATSLRPARAAGYQIITQIPDMGSHFLNPAIQGFDVRKPPILVYACHGRAWQLVALEWAFPSSRSPAAAGATYGLRLGLPLPRRHLRGRRHPGPVPVAQPPDGFEVQLLAPQAGHPSTCGAASPTPPAGTAAPTR